MIKIYDLAKIALLFKCQISLLNCKVLDLVIGWTLCIRNILIKWQTLAAQIILALIAMMKTLWAIYLESAEVALGETCVFTWFFV